MFHTDPVLQPTSPAAIRKDYQRNMSGFIDRLKNQMRLITAEFENLQSDQDLGHALRRFLGVRKRSK